MSDPKTKLVVAAAVLLLAGIVAYFGAKVVIGKQLNKPETRKEIEGIVAAGFDGIVLRPSVSIGRISMLGLGGISLETFQLLQAGRPFLASRSLTIKCSLIKQLLLGSCNLEFDGDFGPDGKVTLYGRLPRGALTADQTYHFDIATHGKIAGLNVGKFFRSSGRAEKGLSLGSFIADGDFDAQLTGQGVPKIKGKFQGVVNDLTVVLNMSGIKKEKIRSTELEFLLAEDGIQFTKPLKFMLFGIKLTYAGGLKFDSSTQWNGTFEVSGGSMLARYFPQVLKCRTRPGNPGKFGVTGPLAEPVCR